MLRFIFIIGLAWLGLEVFGQNAVVSKSADVIVLRGKSYYLHTVQQGQTLYSICKAYGVDVEEVKALNEKKDNTLSLYEVLKIPYIEPFVQQDGKFYYHKVRKGETLYSIARLYAINPKRLLKYNGDYAGKPLSVGSVIRLPLQEITLPEQVSEKPYAEEIKSGTIPEAVTVPEKEKTAEIQISVAGDTKILLQDTLPIPAKEEQQGIPAYLRETVVPAEPFVKIVLLLPLSARKYPVYQDSLEERQSVTLSSRSEMFIGFYEGILLAVDSLKNKGYKIDLHVFDTERSSDKMYMLAHEIDLLRPDLIIGPVYGSVYKALADNLKNKQIPLVYPLSSRSENFGNYPNFIQVNASFEVVAGQMAKWLEKQRKEANIVYINLAGSEDFEEPEKRSFQEQVTGLEGVRLFTWNMEQIPLDSLRTLLLPDRENIVVLPATKEAEVSKVLPLLSVLTDGYRMSVLGLPEWQAFTSIDHETYYKVNTKLFTYSYVDYHSETAQNIAGKYRQYFCTEPGSLIFKAFDMGLYFIEMAARYRDRTLDALDYYGGETGCSKFRFKRMRNGVGKENDGFYIVNFSSDYHLKIENPDG